MKGDFMKPEEYNKLKVGDSIRHRIYNDKYLIIKEAINPADKNSKVFVAVKTKFIASP